MFNLFATSQPSVRRLSPVAIVCAHDPLAKAELNSVKLTISSLARSADPLKMLAFLSYYTDQSLHKKIEGTEISSSKLATTAYSAFVRLRQQLATEPAAGNPIIKKLTDSQGANEGQIDTFYRSTVRLLTIIALKEVSLKNKQIALNQWDSDSLTDLPAAKAHRAIVRACGFDHDGFVCLLRQLIIKQALFQVAEKGLVVPELDRSTDALISRLFHRTRFLQLPMTKAKQFQLLEDTANFIIDLAEEGSRILTPVREVQTPNRSKAIIDDYRQKIAARTYPPTLKALLAGLLLAAVVLTVMMGLQVALAGMTPIVALSMINILAAAGSTANMWATTTLVLTAATALATFLLPRYSLYPTTRFKALFAAADRLSQQCDSVVQDKADKEGPAAATPNPGLPGITTMRNPMLDALSGAAAANTSSSSRAPGPLRGALPPATDCGLVGAAAVMAGAMGDPKMRRGSVWTTFGPTMVRPNKGSGDVVAAPAPAPAPAPAAVPSPSP